MHFLNTVFCNSFLILLLLFLLLIPKLVLFIWRRGHLSLRDEYATGFFFTFSTSLLGEIIKTVVLIICINYLLLCNKFPPKLTVQHHKHVPPHSYVGQDSEGSHLECLWFSVSSGCAQAVRQNSSSYENSNGASVALF